MDAIKRKSDRDVGVCRHVAVFPKEKKNFARVSLVP